MIVIIIIVPLLNSSSPVIPAVACQIRGVRKDDDLVSKYNIIRVQSGDVYDGEYYILRFRRVLH